jgi:hypothetical protein
LAEDIYEGLIERRHVAPPIDSFKKNQQMPYLRVFYQSQLSFSGK